MLGNTMLERRYITGVVSARDVKLHHPPDFLDEQQQGSSLSPSAPRRPARGTVPSPRHSHAFQFGPREQVDAAQTQYREELQKKHQAAVEKRAQQQAFGKELAEQIESKKVQGAQRRNDEVQSARCSNAALSTILDMTREAAAAKKRERKEEANKLLQESLEDFRLRNIYSPRAIAQARAEDAQRTNAAVQQAQALNERKRRERKERSEQLRDEQLDDVEKHKALRQRQATAADSELVALNLARQKNDAATAKILEENQRKRQKMLERRTLRTLQVGPLTASAREAREAQIDKIAHTTELSPNSIAFVTCGLPERVHASPQQRLVYRRALEEQVKETEKARHAAREKNERQKAQERADAEEYKREEEEKSRVRRMKMKELAETQRLELERSARVRRQGL